MTPPGLGVVGNPAGMVPGRTVGNDTPLGRPDGIPGPAPVGGIGLAVVTNGNVPFPEPIGTIGDGGMGGAIEIRVVTGFVIWPVICAWTDSR